MSKLLELLRNLAKLEILVPLLLIIALLIVVLTVADIPTVLAHIRRIPISTMAISLGLVAAYLTLKGLLFHLLLTWLNIHPGWRPFALAYAIGEMVLTIPAGMYTQNYVLRRVAGIDFSFSAAATTAIIIVEGTISLVTLAILGVPGWQGLRIGIAVFLAAAVAATAVLVTVEWVQQAAVEIVCAGPLRRVGPELIETAQGLRLLLTPSYVAISVALAAAYMFASMAAFLMVARAVGIAAFTFRQATTILFVALAFLGLIEIGGIDVSEAWGYSANEAEAALLGFRLVWLGATWLLAGPVVLWLRGELR